MKSWQKGWMVCVAVLLLVIGCACGAVPEDRSSADTPPSQTQPQPTEVSEEKEVDPACLQEISVLPELEPPDTIGYLVNGEKTVFAKGSEEYTRILELNNSRYEQPLEPTLGMLSPEYATNGVYLLYEYAEKAPVYFNLARASEDDTSHTAVQLVVGNRDGLTEEQRQWLFVYGHLAPADELLDYLDTVIAA